MEKILKQILLKLDKLDTLETRFDNSETRFDTLETSFDNFETRFGALETRFDNLETRFDTLEKRFDRLEPLVYESHQWLRALVESNEVHRAEMDNMKNDVARIEGVLVGFDNSLEVLKKAQ